MTGESGRTETSSTLESRQRFFRQELSIGRAGLSEQSRRGRCDIRIRKSPQDELPSAISTDLRAEIFISVRSRHSRAGGNPIDIAIGDQCSVSARLRGHDVLWERLNQPCEGSSPTFRPIIRISSRALLFCTTPGRIR